MYFIFIFSLTSCKTYSNVDTKNENLKSTYIVDTSNLNAIADKHIVDIFNSRIGIDNSWNKPNEIDPTNLFLFYVFPFVSKVTEFQSQSYWGYYPKTGQQY